MVGLGVKGGLSSSHSGLPATLITGIRKLFEFDLAFGVRLKNPIWCLFLKILRAGGSQ